VEDSKRYSGAPLIYIILEFTRDRKSMSVLVKDKSGKNPNIMYIKGAPEYLLESSTHIMNNSG
jgi:Ca2+-transporting ATPase